MGRISTQAAFALFFSAALVLGTSNVGAQVMESATYKIEADSVNMGGGLSTSSSYTLESTAGEVATGESSSATYSLHAGYQQMLEDYIAIAAVSDVSMSPNLTGASSETSNGSTTVSVTTDSAAGYQLTISASQSPAMQSASTTIADYAPAGADPDYTFTTAASDIHLGYSPYGDDVVDRFLDDGAACNAGAGNGIGTCWDGLATSTETIASSGAPNHPGGESTVLYFRVGVGSAAAPTPGTYVATTTVTALSL